jgi:hypothetical protein
MEIKIILDKTRQISDEDAYLYKSESDYLYAYIQLQAAIKEEKNATAIVYDDSMKTWLYTGLSKYEDAEIAVEEITFRELLKRKWNINYDIELTDYEIQRDNLLSLSIEGFMEQSLSSFVCREFISEYLDKQYLDNKKFGQLMSDLIQFNKKKEQLPEIVKTVFNYKVSNWLKANPEYKSIIKLIKNNIDDLYEKICLYKLTANYPDSVQEKCLDKNWIKVFKGSELNVDGLDTSTFFSSERYNILQNELNIFFEKYKREHPQTDIQSFDELLNYFSGEINMEYDFFEQLLKDNPQFIDQPLITRIKISFKPIIESISQRINALKYLIKPPIPTAFDKNFQLEDAINWAIEEYLPYKFWMEINQKFDEKVIKWGEDFADYIFESYGDFSYHYKNVLYRFIFNYKEIINQTDIPILLIIDNFNYKFLEQLKMFFSENQIELIELSPYLGLLPTTTSIAKKALITGKRHKPDRKSYDYKKDMITSWQEFFPEHKMTYIPKLGNLDDYKVSDKELILINYNEIDKELHSSYEKTAIEHREAITFKLDNIVKRISNFISGNHLEDKARIFFVSDHGSTLITEDISNKIDMNYFSDKSIDENYRFVKVEEREFNTLKENKNISDTVYFLNKELSGDGQNYLIARGYSRFRQIQERFYVHGGTSPEEIIIPTGYFEVSKKQIQKLILNLLKDEYRLKTKEKIDLRLANPNAHLAENIFIEIKSNDFELAKIQIEALDSKSDKKISSEVRIRNKQMDTFNIFVHYEISGRTFHGKFEFPIKIKTMVETTFDFENI